MSFVGRDADRCRSILHLKIDVTASSDELLRDGRMPFFDCDEERCDPIIGQLSIDVTEQLLEARCNVDLQMQGLPNYRY
jgi:hypothetical protein